MIEIGEYIRTSKGYIVKVEHNKTVQGLKFLNVQYGDIVKHSKNIIDLIGVGDIIKVQYLEEHKTVFKYIESNKQLEVEKNFLSKEKGYILKSILTHEQYAQNAYKVGVENEQSR